MDDTWKIQQYNKPGLSGTWESMVVMLVQIKLSTTLHSVICQHITFLLYGTTRQGIEGKLKHAPLLIEDPS